MSKKSERLRTVYKKQKSTNQVKTFSENALPRSKFFSKIKWVKSSKLVDPNSLLLDIISKDSTSAGAIYSNRIKIDHCSETTNEKVNFFERKDAEKNFFASFSNSIIHF